MKSRWGLGVLLLAALLSGIAIWLLPVNSAAADILLLITGGAVIRPTTQTEAYEIQTYRTRLTLKSTTNLPHESDFITNFEENLTLSVAKTHNPVTPESESFSTKIPNSSWINADQTSDVQPDTRRIAGAELSDRTRFYPRLYFVDKQSATTDITTDVMETDKMVCESGPNNAELLAIVTGAVFLTILLSALLYQFAVFMKNKKAQRDNSVFIIENEVHKYDVEANGLEPETKL
ncbi:uncharacterized protein LOC122935214 [Bufo gargarizans]|uniref:uncharacterized protein LOC122935214 n=1 Tax=Bufo gargarizans TaxID=30331 RepID=UPI001CF1BBD7|nr:uncharacterized protein LOC122935214 [Bufo gargarizans]